MKRITTEAYGALRDALPVAFWFKKDFERYLGVALRDHPELLAGINFLSVTKRESAATLVDRLVTREDRYRETTLDLILELSQKERFSDIERLPEPDRSERLREAKEAIAILRRVTAQLAEVRAESEQHRAAREAEAHTAAAARRFADDLAGLKVRFLQLQATASPQRRGLELEPFLAKLLSLFDLEPRLSYTTPLEQIDGSFRLNSHDYIIEAKWQTKPVSREAVDTFASKIGRKGKNALGLFVAVNGLSSVAREAHRERTPFITMDGADLYAVLEGRIRLDDLLSIKQRHANDTGSCYHPAMAII
ncbi:MAG: restriction endonuclease [Brachybacterium sp.]